MDDFIELLDQTPEQVLYDGETNSYVTLDTDEIVPLLTTSMAKSTGELVLSMDVEWPDKGERIILAGHKTAWIYHEGSFVHYLLLCPRNIMTCIQARLRFLAVMSSFLKLNIRPCQKTG